MNIIPIPMVTVPPTNRFIVAALVLFKTNCKIGAAKKQGGVITKLEMPACVSQCKYLCCESFNSPKNFPYSLTGASTRIHPPNIGIQLPVASPQLTAEK